ncbi:hypothetical protein BEWA_046530 [Theileria equi strain WA]|uniref:Uncharacterized protein n=1 Tax=Theileria equi strain WA TaxID=1537102 RepID=L1LA98_THEEQ|nr:hypothetical protein BEWA_046530 [Theileria equi strain WA]EKX72189.1 hypothetical protein BEWA_046530 [Theileria equi strain WA]|eukprot:XP_004831641.1 hypothetical protein BEWA_046530 [Theileria equi strain WA]
MGTKTVDIDISKKNDSGSVKIDTDNKPVTKDGAVLCGYVKRTYRVDKEYNIKNIKKGGTSQNVFATLGLCSSVSVFFWKTKLDKPLLIQLGENGDYYKTDNDHDWSLDSSIGSHNLLTTLDERNCRKNSLHVIDIGQNSRKNSYNCPYCGPGKILLDYDDRNNGRYNYIAYHYTAASGFGNIRNGNDTIFSIPEKIITISAYWYTKEAPTPLLFCYGSGGSSEWYSRYDGDRIWSSLMGSPLSTRIDPTILQATLQENCIPKVIIDLSEPVNASYSPTNNTLKFKVESTEISSNSGLWKFTHTMNKSGIFKTKEIVHKNEKLEGVKFFYQLNSISAYYYEDDPADRSKLLLVGLEIRDGTRTKYEYYKRPDNSGYWIELNQLEGDTEPLKEVNTKLEMLKKEYFPEPFDASIIAGGVIVGLACLCLLGIAMWKVGPSVRTLLASRQPLL